MEFHRNLWIVDFRASPLSGESVIHCDVTNGNDAAQMLRMYADRKSVYVVDKNRSGFAGEVAAELAAGTSPCFPVLMINVGGSAGESSRQGTIAGAETRFAGNDDEAAKLIEEYAEGVRRFDKARLTAADTGQLPATTDVLIVGGGITGLYAAGKIAAAGHSFSVVEKDPIVGGIWSKYANATSQVNTSEGAYRLFDHQYRSNTDHSSTAEMLEDIAALFEDIKGHVYTEATVENIDKTADGYSTTVSHDGSTFEIKSRGVLLAVNDRVGSPRAIEWDGQERYKGSLTTGHSDETAGIDWTGKKVVVVGMGAFAVENARTALEAGADHVTVVGRRHGTICPKIIDYLNFSTPYDESFEHDKKSNIRNMMLWKKLYEASGAAEPECWMGKVKHTGHTISVSDIWFIAHHLGKLDTVAGSIERMYESGVIVNGKKIEADIVVNCIGFLRNASGAKELCGYDEVYNVNLVDRDFMYVADAFIDDDAFNSFFGSSVLEMTEFYLEVFLQSFGSNVYDQIIATPGVEKIDIEERSWSHYIRGATALIDAFPSFADAAKNQIDKRTKRFLDVHDLETYVAENKREWIDTHTLLAGRELPESEQLPYVFERLATKKLR